MKPDKTKIARHLRQRQTEAEKKLWGLLRNRNFENLKFRRQHPLKDYIVDFYCDELQLIIELDGGYHNTAEQKDKDLQRDYHLSFLGYRILRYNNAVVMSDEKSIYQDIKTIKDSSPLSAGEGLGVRGKTLLSTKKLTLNQKELLLNSGMAFVEYNTISIDFSSFNAPKHIENAIFTSKNSVRSVFLNREGIPKIKNCFCVGEKTKLLLEENGQKVAKTTHYGSELADYLTKNHKNDTFYFFCGNKRLNTIPEALKEAKITFSEIETYKTELNPVQYDRTFDGVLFFSPSGVQSYFKANPNVLQGVADKGGLPVGILTAFCIGTTTAAEAQKHTNNVVIANSTSVESVIAKAVKTLRNYD